MSGILSTVSNLFIVGNTELISVVVKHPDADGLYVEVRIFFRASHSSSFQSVAQQINIGEETGPRTVVSGLVNYIPIEQMRDKYLVAVVSACILCIFTWFQRILPVQLEASKHAGSQELCYGAMCMCIDCHILQPTHLLFCRGFHRQHLKRVKTVGLNWSSHPRAQSLATACTSRVQNLNVCGLPSRCQCRST